MVFGIEISFGKSIVLQGEFLGLDISETFGRVPNAKRVDVGLVMTAGLVGSNKQLNFQMICDIGAILEATSETRYATGHVRNQIGRRLEGSRDGHIATLHILEIHLPRYVDALGILFPLHVHLVNVISSTTGQEVVARIGRRLSRIGCVRPRGGGSP